MDPTMMAVLSGVGMLLIGQVVKRYGFEGKYVAAALAVAIGIGYTFFKMAVPQEQQEALIGFVTTAFTTSWVIYEFVWKPVRSKIEEPTPL